MRSGCAGEPASEKLWCRWIGMPGISAALSCPPQAAISRRVAAFSACCGVGVTDMANPPRPAT